MFWTSVVGRLRLTVLFGCPYNGTLNFSVLSSNVRKHPVRQIYRYLWRIFVEIALSTETISNHILTVVSGGVLVFSARELEPAPSRYPTTISSSYLLRISLNSILDSFNPYVSYFSVIFFYRFLFTNKCSFRVYVELFYWNVSFFIHVQHTRRSYKSVYNISQRKLTCTGDNVWG